MKEYEEIGIYEYYEGIEPITNILDINPGDTLYCYRLDKELTVEKFLYGKSGGIRGIISAEEIFYCTYEIMRCPKITINPSTPPS